MWKFFFDTVWESINKQFQKNKKCIPKYLRKLIIKKKFGAYLKVQKSLTLNKSTNRCVKCLQLNVCA